MAEHPIVLVVSVTAGAAIVSALLIVCLFPLMQRYALARPNARSSHVVPTPQGGGMAVIGAVLIAAMVAPLIDQTHVIPRLPLFALGVLLLTSVGAIDDIRPIPVLPRLIMQAVAVALLMATIPAQVRLVPALPGTVEAGLLLVAALWFVNLTNFMDGLDWLTVGAMVPLTGAIALFGLAGEASAPAMLVAAALCGGLIGFAPFNRPRARLFLGDVGSLPIGLLVGWLLFDVAARAGLAAAILLPLYHCADATITLLRRLLRGEKVWEAHRSHFYQQATTGGFSPLAVSGHIFTLNIVLAGLAWIAAATPSPAMQAVLVVVGALLVGAVLARFSRGRGAALERSMP